MLKMGSSLLLIGLKDYQNYHLASLIFFLLLCLPSISLAPTLIFIIFFLLLTSDWICSFFPIEFRYFFYSFLTLTFKTINFPINTIFAAAIKFDVLFKFLIQVKIFPNFPSDFSFLRLFRNVLFIFHIFVDLPDLFLLLISNIACGWRMCVYNFILFAIVGASFRPRTGFMLVNVPCRLEKNGYSDVPGWSVYMSVKLS